MKDDDIKRTQDNSKHNVVLAAINKYIATNPKLHKISSADLHIICDVTSERGIIDGIKTLRKCSMPIAEERLLYVPTSSTSTFYDFVQSKCQDWYIEERTSLGLKDAKDIIDFLVANNMCTRGPVTA